MAALIGDVVTQLDCPDHCAHGCPSCILRPDMNMAQVTPDRDIYDGFEGELYRCIAGTHLQVTWSEWTGQVSFEGGRPASTWAWAFVVGDGLVLSPEPQDASTQGEPEWTVPLRDEQVIEAADRLTTLMHHDHGRKPTDPLFISMIGT